MGATLRRCDGKEGNGGIGANEGPGFIGKGGWKGIGSP